MNNDHNSPRRPKFLLGLGILVLAAMIFAACGGTAPEPTTEVPPAETEQAAEVLQPTEIAPTPAPVVDMEQITDVLWILLGSGDAANPTVVPRDTLISLVFSPDGQVSGSAGCNNYSSSYSVDPDGSLSIQTPFAVTMMFCPSGMDQEAAYLGAFENAQSLGLNAEGRLEIVYDSGQPYEEKLIYAQGETPLVGTRWLLVAHGDVNDPTPVQAGTNVSTIFSEDGNVSGSGGCNYFAGSYEVDGEVMSIGPLASTLSICEQSSDQEELFLAALGSAETYQLFGQFLSISYNDGKEALIFSSANLPLTGTLWTLNAVDGAPVAEDLSITAIFAPATEEEPGRVAGSAGCNDYSAGYSLEEDKLTIEMPISTMKFCESGMDEEAAFLAAIEGQHTFEIIGDTMDLVTEVGTLTFVADRTLLSGALWVLISLGDFDQPQEPVAGANFTAQFTRNPESPSGVVAGTTGCNEYSTAYTASEQEIKINLPQTTQNENCPAGLAEQEQAFFLAMNDATTFSILGNTLILPYDGGQQALVLAATQTEIAGRRPLAELNGSEWFLHYINNQPILPGTLIDARFNIAEDGLSGQLSGSAGCNTYYAEFGEQLGVKTTLTSTSNCFTPDGIMVQENDFTASLSRTYGYWLTGKQLVLNTGKGALTFRDAPPDSAQDQTHLLQNVKWFLINYNQQPSVAGSAEPFIFFNPDMTFSGNTGCNEMSGGYTTNLEQISISNIQSGEQACPDENTTKQERVILANLNDAAFFVVADSSMQLGSERGTLYYSNVPVERPEPSEPPAAVIKGPAEAMVGEIVRFDGQGSTSEIGITNYRWDFGDGKSSDGPVVENIYLAEGTYQVTLTVVDKIGQRGSANQEITINAQPSEQIPPTAVITGPTDGFVGEPVTFNADGSTSGSSPIQSFAWDFGDGTSSPASPNTSVVKLYEQPGTFQVTVTATDAEGLSASASLQIVVDTRLEGPVWSLFPVLPRTAITMQFLQGELEGFSGCNTYSGTYTATQNEDGTYQVEVKDLVTTRLMCPDDLMEQETEYIDVLGVVTTAQVDGNILTLNSADAELTFYEVGTERPEELWR